MKFIDYLHLEKCSKEEILASIEELDRLEFPWPWSVQSWGEVESVARYRLFLITEGNQVIGFALFDHLEGDSSCHLLKIIVRKRAQRSGLGRELLDYSISNLLVLGVASMYLEVSSKNRQAISFYTKRGFEKLRTIASFYADGSDAIAMEYIFKK